MSRASSAHACAALVATSSPPRAVKGGVGLSPAKVALHHAARMRKAAKASARTGTREGFGVDARRNVRNAEQRATGGTRRRLGDAKHRSEVAGDRTRRERVHSTENVT